MSYFDNDPGDRWNGVGTHHDRFLTNSEMLFIGVGLYRTAMWVKENTRRLTPMEKAQYEVEVDRWKAYLAWEETTPGAREAREHLIALQEAQERSLQDTQEAAWRARWVWRPLSLVGAVMWISNFIPNREEIFVPVGFVAWWSSWRFCRKVKRSWHRAREHRLMREAYEAEHPEPSRYLPVLWKAQS